MRQHWRGPGYWRWLWRERVREPFEKALVIAAILALGISSAVGGFLVARTLTSDLEKAFADVTSDRLVTVIRAIDGKVETVVETQVETQTKTRVSTETGDTRLVTVVRDGKTVVLRVPGKTVTVTDTVRLPGKTKVVTKTQTNTVDRPTTTTERSTTTHTETVTGPQRTVTETETETVTETVTVTETEKPGKPLP